MKRIFHPTSILLILIVFLLILLSHHLMVLIHEWTHGTVAWLAGIKASPFDIQFTGGKPVITPQDERLTPNKENTGFQERKNPMTFMGDDTAFEMQRGLIHLLSGPLKTHRIAKR